MFNLFVLPWDQPLYKKLVLWLLVGLSGIQHLSIYLSVYPSFCLSISIDSIYFLFIKWFTYLSICLPEGKNMRGFLQKWTLAGPNRSNSARRPQKLKLTASKRKYLAKFFNFCIKLQNETILRDFRVAELTASYQCILPCCHLICLKYSACFEKRKPRHTKCRTCHAKSF